jgi:hypothetical protein
MALIKQSGLQVTVATIAARDAIVNRPEHLVVHVQDAIADTIAGPGPAVYRWALDSLGAGSWILVSASCLTASCVTAGEDLTTDNHICGAPIVSGDIEKAYMRLLLLTFYIATLLTTQTILNFMA